ncbi:hypothetical protein OAN83_04335, partial [Alphaproteobacteria bacterium]|nr:hypothetical protein [Alphaproteobacteria bacterium]
TRLRTKTYLFVLVLIRPSLSPAFQHINFVSEENIDVKFFKIQEDFTHQNYMNVDEREGGQFCPVYFNKFSYFCFT